MSIPRFEQWWGEQRIRSHAFPSAHPVENDRYLVTGRSSIVLVGTDRNPPDASGNGTSS